MKLKSSTVEPDRPSHCSVHSLRQAVPSLSTAVASSIKWGECVHLTMLLGRLDKLLIIVPGVKQALSLFVKIKLITVSGKVSRTEYVSGSSQTILSYCL